MKTKQYIKYKKKKKISLSLGLGHLWTCITGDLGEQQETPASSILVKVSAAPRVAAQQDGFF